MNFYTKKLVPVLDLGAIYYDIILERGEILNEILSRRKYVHVIFQIHKFLRRGYLSCSSILYQETTKTRNSLPIDNTV